MRKLLFIAAILLLSARVNAQTNYCDTTPPTSGTGVVGTTEVVQVCISLNDTNGNPVTPTSWTMYDTLNGSTPTTQPITMTKGSTGQNGLVLYTGSYLPATAGTHSLQVTATGNGKESAKSAAFLLAVSLPLSAPTAPVKLSTQ